MGAPLRFHFPLAARYAIEMGYPVRRASWKRTYQEEFHPTAPSKEGKRLAWLRYLGGLWYYSSWTVASGKPVQFTRVVRAGESATDDFTIADMRAEDWTLQQPGCPEVADDCDCEAQRALLAVAGFAANETNNEDDDPFDIFQANPLLSCANFSLAQLGCDCGPETQECEKGSFWNGKECVSGSDGSGGGMTSGTGSGGSEDGGGTAGGGGSGSGGNGGGSGGGGNGGGGNGGNGDKPDEKVCQEGEVWDEKLKKCVRKREPNQRTADFDWTLNVDPLNTVEGGCIPDGEGKAIADLSWGVEVTINGYPPGTSFHWSMTYGAYRHTGRLLSGDYIGDWPLLGYSGSPGGGLVVKIDVTAPIALGGGQFGSAQVLRLPEWCNTPAPGMAPPPFGPTPPPVVQQCPEGEHYDAGLDECVEDETCPSGQVWDEALFACRDACDGDHEGWSAVLQQCQCDAGYHYNGSGVCVADGVSCTGEHEHYDPDSNTCECDAGFYRAGADCVEIPACGTNEEWNSEEEACVCAPGYQRNESDICVEIPPDCGPNEEWDAENNACKCSAGFHRDEETGGCVAD
ncbi:MAG: hypothetical protein JNJ83_10915 [Verrucomicrobiaceae bacterium]|nr:hypothetical protein [Verrucomicrobiaceae bacterium]